jgi:hypothetical protein
MITRKDMDIHPALAHQLQIHREAVGLNWKGTRKSEEIASLEHEANTLVGRRVRFHLSASFETGAPITTAVTGSVCGKGMPARSGRARL